MAKLSDETIDEILKLLLKNKKNKKRKKRAKAKAKDKNKKSFQDYNPFSTKPSFMGRNFGGGGGGGGFGSGGFGAVPYSSVTKIISEDVTKPQPQPQDNTNKSKPNYFDDQLKILMENSKKLADSANNFEKQLEEEKKRPRVKEEPVKGVPKSFFQVAPPSLREFKFSHPNVLPQSTDRMDGSGIVARSRPLESLVDYTQPYYEEPREQLTEILEDEDEEEEEEDEDDMTEYTETPDPNKPRPKPKIIDDDMSDITDVTEEVKKNMKKNRKVFDVDDDDDDDVSFEFATPEDEERASKKLAEQIMSLKNKGKAKVPQTKINKQNKKK
jgi:hypothetical protein